MSKDEFITASEKTEQAFQYVIDNLGDRYEDLIALANQHKDLRERLLCTVAAENVTDLCVHPLKYIKAPHLIPALTRIIVEYRTHWRLARSVFYKRGP